MKPGAEGYRVAVVGASSLLGKELLAVLEARKFHVSRLVRFEADEEEPDLPIVDLQAGSQAAIGDESVRQSELDLVFVAARPNSLPSFLQTAAASGGPGASGLAASCVVIDLAEAIPDAPDRVISVPFLDHALAASRSKDTKTRHLVSPHPATIVLSALLLRLASLFELKTAVAQIFSPASALGPKAIEELQKQTVSLLSFQKIPRAVFGAQLAFNLLPRLSRTNRDDLTSLEELVRNQLRDYLRGRAPLPALRAFRAAVFYSLAVSLYVETARPAAPEKIAQALAGDRVRLRRLTEQAPSQAETSGTGEILVDAVVPDAGRPGGAWIWSTVDDLRLAAENAVEIAEAFEKAFNHKDANAQTAV